MSRVDTIFHTGDNSLLLSTSQEEGLSNIAVDLPPQSWGANLYFRVFLYIPQGTITGFITLARFRGPYNETIDDHDVVVDISVTSDRKIQIYHHSSGSRIESGAWTVPQGSWFCLSGRVAVGSNGVATAMIDGNIVAAHNDIDTLPTGGIVGADFGIVRTRDGQQEASLYLDDVVVSNENVACVIN